MNLLKVAHPALRLELRTALFRALKENAPVTTSRVLAELGGALRPVRIHVRPARRENAAGDFILVVFETAGNANAASYGEIEAGTGAETSGEEAGGEEANGAAPQATEEPIYNAGRNSNSIAHQLEEENEHLREQVGATVEQYEASLEELKASNEELQAINEEMRSSTEELETSKEELQSINEELTTVNQELKSSVEELSRANSDLQNFMAATDIATIFLDRQLRIQRFTPRIQELFNVIPTDTGRPLSDITHKLSALDMTADAAQVLRDLRPIEREVSSGGRWYLERLLPYQNAEDRIDGVVLTFVDITERKLAEESLRVSEERYRTLVNASTNAMWRMSADGAELLEMTGDILQTHDPRRAPERDWLRRYVHPDDRPRVGEAWREAIRDRSVYDQVHRSLTSDGTYRHVHSRGVPFVDAQGDVREWVGTATDVTDMVKAEEALRQSEERLRLTIENVTDYAIFNLDVAGNVATWNEGGRRMTGYDPDDIIGQHFRVFYTLEDRIAQTPEKGLETAKTAGRYEEEGWRVRRDGTLFWGNEIITAIHDASGALTGFVKITRDLSEYKKAQEQRALLEREATLLSERNRMAQELHDTLSQGFTAIKMQMDAAEAALQEQSEQNSESGVAAVGAAESSADPSATQQDEAAADGKEAGRPQENKSLLQHIARTRAIAQQSLAEARSSIRALRAPLLVGGNLTTALQQLAEQAGDNARVRLFTDGTPFPLAAPIENDLYRIGQEALTNALRHSQARHIILSLTYFADQVHLTIKDDGTGFDTRARREGFGVTGMQERATRIGAELNITSQPGQGTEVSLTLNMLVG